MLCDIVRALFALHKAGITHGSVVMDNIYVDVNGKGILGEYSFLHDTVKNSLTLMCDIRQRFS